jgi:predicted metal-dependent phosphoesterase TrpH
MMKSLLKVDLHIHTSYSPDSFTSLQALLHKAGERGLDRVAITDHNTINGALEAYKMDPEHVIVGEEIDTGNGEILGYYIKENIPAGLPPREVIRRLREQEAFISVSHPFDPRRVRWSLKELEELAPLVDAFEIFNGRCYNATSNAQSMAFCRKHNLPGTVGSDSHVLLEVGRSYLELPWFVDAEGMRETIANAKMTTFSSSPLVSIISTAAGMLPKKTE